MSRPFFVFLLCAATVTPGWSSAARSLAAQQAASNRVVPLRIGERFTYNASFGMLPIGHATLELGGIETVRDRPAYRATLKLSGGTLWYKIRDSTVSWFDPQTHSTLRFVQHIREGGYKADRDYQIYPERATYARQGEPEVPSVSEPLDDLSFLYYLRTIPFEIGQRYEFFRYFQPQGNPLIIRVVRRERVTVPAGTFNTIVVQPQIDATGLFSKKERAEVWISDDSARIIVQLKSHLRLGSLRLYLKEYTPGVSAEVTGAR
jgi:hypothetical protein